MFEFHISRAARDRYGVTDVLFAFDGNAVFANPAASRELAHRINQVRGAENDPARPVETVQPAALFAMGLIDEAAHALFEYYRKTVAPQIMSEAIQHFEQQVGAPALGQLLLAFTEQFPNAEVYAGTLTAADWLAGSTDGTPHTEAALEELMLLWFENQNPAFAPFRELFDDTTLAETTVYRQVTAQLPAFFAAMPDLGAGRGGIFSLLLSVLTAGGPLSDQLSLLRGRWGFAVDDLLRRLLMAGDILKEEEVALWLQFNPANADTQARRARFGGQGDAHGEVPTFTTAPNEYEAFSPDQEWMPRTVMIAKSTYVWLHQLSRFYGHTIERLDQIPDAELESLARRGMNALWLIGVWERSRASKTIKNLCGNPDAVASAYSLYSYTIAGNLGGEPAYRDLRDRCLRFGIRLASDMVPNHMGIDSTWVVEHPEWFLSRRDSPYPAYSFTGPDLSGDDRVEIKIEDHYYGQTDAAVVFQRRDKWTGDIELIYHGNDGTSFPWNDTAQLNYLSAQVREQVIQTILDVARQFPIIRFDAAMTLAKRHIQRLWFPVPGAGGSIPSRAESAMTTEDFDRAIPEEFWREVVDRVAREVPGTLLLAEAFWLMEGYFVRTLGMHRVYNSAFMVMLRDEDNANYRKVLKNTLEFDPGIMKRYVNFMSNPDERTAIDQFGSGDKFFGVASLMATLPGLPMFGHGQVEGFTEKYGMEYYRPRYDEWSNDALVDRHNREIAPLLHRRDLFAESDNFLLYDLWHEGGGVNENVFAYSNQRDGARALVVYNNSYSVASGTLHHSAAYMDKGAGELRRRPIHDGLALSGEGNVIYGYRNNASGLHHLRRGSALHEHGLHVDLGGYGYAVLLDWRELRADEAHQWDRLCDTLNGRGVEDLDRALIALELEHVHHALRQTLEPRFVREFAALAAQTAAMQTPSGTAARAESDDLMPHSELLEQWIERAAAFVAITRDEYLKRIGAPPQDSASITTPATDSTVAAGQSSSHPERSAAESKDLRSSSSVTIPATESLTPELTAAEQTNEDSLTQTRIRERIHALLRLPLSETQCAQPWPTEARRVLPSQSPLTNAGWVWSPVLAYTLFAAFGESLSLAAPSDPALAIFDTFGLRTVLAEAFARLEFIGEDIWRAASRVRIALSAAVKPAEAEPSGKHAEEVQREAGAAQHGLPLSAWEDGELRWLTGVNTHAGTTYFNREAHAEMLWWRALPELLQITESSPIDRKALEAVASSIAGGLASAAAASYQLSSPVLESVPEAEPPTARAQGLGTDSTSTPSPKPPSSPAEHTDGPAARASDSEPMPEDEAADAYGTGDRRGAAGSVQAPYHPKDKAHETHTAHVIAALTEAVREDAVAIALETAVPPLETERPSPLTPGDPEPEIVAHIESLRPAPPPAPAVPGKSKGRKSKK